MATKVKTSAGYQVMTISTSAGCKKDFERMYGIIEKEAKRRGEKRPLKSDLFEMAIAKLKSVDVDELKNEFFVYKGGANGYVRKNS